MAIKYHLRRAMALPLHVVLLRVYQLISFRFKSYFQEGRDHIFTTLQVSLDLGEPASFRPLFHHAPSVKNLPSVFPELPELVRRTLRHEFDLLGSGWVRVSHDTRAKGLAGHQYRMNSSHPPLLQFTDWMTHEISAANIKTSAYVWGLLKAPYEPIDWHLDFKSGYRWDPKTWWYRIPYAHKPGVDVKVPWELARMHHLAWLALAYGQERDPSLIQEFENQILDFTANNPPRFGVNWRCAMDVAIRAANWILAYEWFRLYGAPLSKEFNKTFRASLTSHGRFIYGNLEKGKDGFRGNHYLADICGLAFISLFLPAGAETQKWEQFTFEALQEEMDYQFFDEGSNFEGSTSYHRLSAEMMLYTTLAFSLRKKSFPSSYFNKLSRMARFSEGVTRPDGDIVQVGDCDSGRFFKIQPLFRNSVTLEENHLSHRCLIDAIDAFLNPAREAKTIEGQWLKELRADLAVKRFSEAPPASSARSPSSSDPKINQMLQSVSSLLSHKTEILLDRVALENKLRSLNPHFQVQILDFNLVNASLSSYHQFGLFIWKNEDSFLSFRCGRVGQKGRGGHDHNDQLAIEFFLQGELKIADPGTGIYTPLPQVRNKYRSVKAHNTPLIRGPQEEPLEPCPLNQGLFSLRAHQDGEVLFLEHSQIVGYCAKRKVIRVIKGIADQTLILDVSFEQELLPPPPHSPPLSKGYGLFI